MMGLAWWIWVAAGLALGIVELLVPGFIFAGFAIGGVLTGILVLMGVPGVTGSLFAELVVFAVISAGAWIALRLFVGVRHNQTKRIDHDIND
ncbi:MAG: hypothetical protein R3D60_02055 [Paracoccaceae bacterium]